MVAHVIHSLWQESAETYNGSHPSTCSESKREYMWGKVRRDRERERLVMGGKKHLGKGRGRPEHILIIFHSNNCYLGRSFFSLKEYIMKKRTWEGKHKSLF